MSDEPSEDAHLSSPGCGDGRGDLAEHHKQIRDELIAEHRATGK